MYVDHCNLNDRTGLATVRLETWKLRGKWKGAEKGRCPLCDEDENVVHVSIAKM
jgi:hypothetical protein